MAVFTIWVETHYLWGTRDRKWLLVYLLLEVSHTECLS